MKLSAPLRVSWDWHWPPVVHPRSGGGPAAEQVRLIAAELGRAGVLMHEIGYPSAEQIRTGLVAEALEKAGGIGSVVVTPDVMAGLGEEGLRGALARFEIWADVTPAGGQARDALRRGAGTTPAWPCLRIYLTAENLEDAALLVTGAVAQGVEKLSLPILPLFGSFLTSPGKRVPPWRDLVEFADRLGPSLASRPDLDLRVHHQSLWTILRQRGHAATGEEAPGHSGCQAASALAYIDPGGVLYPCASLPIPAGRVEEGSITRIWREGEMLRIREAISCVPTACGDCREWKSCRGGCRGWAHYLSGGWRHPGPDCGREIPGQGFSG